MKRDRQAKDSPNVHPWKLTLLAALRHAALGVIYLLLFVVLDRVVLLLPTSYEAPGWYPPTALSVALVVGFGPRYAPLLALGWVLSAAVNYRTILYTNNSLTNAIWFAVVYALAGLILRRLRVNRELEKLRSLGWFLLVSFAADFLGAVTGVWGLVADGFVSRQAYWPTVAAWWFGDAIVITGITPFLLLYIQPRVEKSLWRGTGTATAQPRTQAPSALRSRPLLEDSFLAPKVSRHTRRAGSWLRSLETGAMFASIVASVWLAFSFQLSQHLDLLYVCFLPVVWIGMRRGFRGVAGGLFALTMVPLLALRTTASDPTRFLTVQLLLLLLSLTGLAVGSLVAEREAAHQELLGTARRYQTLVQKSSEGVLLLDSEAKIIHDAAQRSILGHVKEDFLSRSVFDFIHPDDQTAASEVFAKWAEHPGASAALECRVRNKDGTYRWLEVTGTNWLDEPAVAALVVNYRDVSERRAAEEALLGSEARYRELFQNAVFGVYRSTPDGRFTDVNPAFVRIFGYRSAESLKKVNACRLWRKPTEPALILEDYRQLHTSSSGELECSRKDGSSRVIRVHGWTVYNQEGQPACLEGMVEDISERRALEAQLRHAQKMEAVGRLAGGVAHDFNNLLCVILGYSEVILNRLKREDPLWRKVTEIKKAADRVAYLTWQLLAFSRKQIMQPKILNLNSVLYGMSELLHRLIGEDIELITHLDPMLRTVRADPNQFEEVIMSLAANARDAMPQGGKLVLETANLDVSPGSVSGLSAGSYVLLRVSDTGVGMEKEVQTHVFEPFFTTKPMEKGTGLGLATVYGIVQQSGGQISVQSAPSDGTVFDIYLPMAEAAAEEHLEHREKAERLHSKGTILIVEDEPALRQLIKDVLFAHGYDVLEACDGATAIRCARAHPGRIHLLLTDVILPGMNGPDIAQALRRLRPEVQLLFISGYTRDTEMHDDQFEGAPFLKKPFTPGAIIEKIHEALPEQLLRSAGDYI